MCIVWLFILFSLFILTTITFLFTGYKSYIECALLLLHCLGTWRSKYTFQNFTLKSILCFSIVWKVALTRKNSMWMIDYCISKVLTLLKMFSQYFDHINISLNAESVFVGVTLFTYIRIIRTPFTAPWIRNKEYGQDIIIHFCVLCH